MYYNNMYFQRFEVSVFQKNFSFSELFKYVLMDAEFFQNTMYIL